MAARGPAHGKCHTTHSKVDSSGGLAFGADWRPEDSSGQSAKSSSSLPGPVAGQTTPLAPFGSRSKNVGRPWRPRQPSWRQLKSSPSRSTATTCAARLALSVDRSPLGKSPPGAVSRARSRAGQPLLALTGNHFACGDQHFASKPTGSEPAGRPDPVVVLIEGSRERSRDAPPSGPTLTRRSWRRRRNSALRPLCELGPLGGQSRGAGREC